MEDISCFGPKMFRPTTNCCNKVEQKVTTCNSQGSHFRLFLMKNSDHRSSSYKYEVSPTSLCEFFMKVGCLLGLNYETAYHQNCSILRKHSSLVEKKTKDFLQSKQGFIIHQNCIVNWALLCKISLELVCI